MKNKVFAKISANRGVNGLVLAAAAILFLVNTTPAQTTGKQRLPGHVPKAVAHLKPMGHFDGTNRLHLAISLPLRNREALDSLLREIYDPASPNFHHYLTPEQSAQQFGPTEQDYQAVIAFAEANGLTVTHTFPNRVVLGVSGSVPEIEKAFHVTLKVYQHPTEKRTFYAPDVEPYIDLGVPVFHVSGLDDFVVPQPLIKTKPVNEAGSLTLDETSSAMNITPAIGSGPNGDYIGNDFRAAYAPGVTLNGAGQTVGLMEFDGFYTNDIVEYERTAGLPIVPVSKVLIFGSDGNPSPPGGTGQLEATMDIEVAIAMAPGLSSVVVYEAPNISWAVIYVLEAMCADSHVKQFSSSWFIGNDPSFDQVYSLFALQGQSFFQASGDLGNPPEADDPNITIVGGTTLTMNGSGASYASETVWNWGYDGLAGGYACSGGGISGNYAIPSYQTNIDMSANQGSTTMRNVPDVALTADQVAVYCYLSNGRSLWLDEGGTSAASPLWAGFAALINQQAANNNTNPVGFINPAIYAIGNSTDYANCFHDITTGNNTNANSDNLFFACPGYDLCTGWGTPNGQALIDSLAGSPLPLPATITGQPQSQAVVVGSIAHLYVVANSSFPLSYQWYFNGTNITQNATNASYNYGPVQFSDSGLYSVTVSNVYGGVISSNAMITVVPLLFLSQPKDLEVVEGGTATFSATVSNVCWPVYYQWYFNTTNLLPGKTSLSLTLANVQLTQAGNYSVVASNAYGSVVSSNAVLAVYPCTPPPSGLVGWWRGEGNALDSVGTNDGTLTWFSFGPGEVGQGFVGDGGLIYIAPSPSLNVSLFNGFTVEMWVNPTTFNSNPSLAEWIISAFGWTSASMELLNSGQIRGGVSVVKADHSGLAFMTVDSTSTLARNSFQHLAMTYDKPSGTLTLYCNGAITGSGNVGSMLSYYGDVSLYFGASPGGFGPITLDEISVYNRALSSSEIAAIYNAKVAGKCFEPTPPIITIQPTNQTVYQGDSAVFGVDATGTRPLSYQWLCNGNVRVGETNATLTLNNIQPGDAGSYAAVVSNIGGSTTSVVAKLQVLIPANCVVLYGSQTNFTFQGDTTYYISGALNLYGTNTFEGGAVIKYARGASLILNGAGNAVQTLASAYCPVIFTARDDNSVGQTIGGSTGSPSGYYASAVLVIEQGASCSTLSNLRVSYAQTAFVNWRTDLSIYNAQFVSCQTGIITVQAGTSVENALFAQTTTNFYLVNASPVVAENVTFDGSVCVAFTPAGLPPSQVTLNNCILNDVGTLGQGASVGGSYNGFYNSPVFGTSTVTNNFYPFQTVGAGNYYLAGGCSFTNAGTPNIDPVLLADLATKTTYPPLVYTNAAISANTIWGPQAPRDNSGVPDLGYHYDPLDYLVGNVTVPASLTLTNGVAVGLMGSASVMFQPSLTLQPGGNLFSQGTALNLNHLAHYANVQEQPVNMGFGALATPIGSGVVNSALFRFTDISMAAGGVNNNMIFPSLRWSSELSGPYYVSFRDCQLHGCSFEQVQDPTPQTLTYTNNLFDRCSWQIFGPYGLVVSMHNNLFRGGSITGTGIPGTVQDNLFDQTGLSGNAGVNGLCSNNGFTAGTTNSLGGANNLTNLLADYQVGPLGNYYYPSTVVNDLSSLVDAGSTTADQVGLSDYTTQVNQVPEGSSVVDIGFHYVALDANGNPITNSVTVFSTPGTYTWQCPSQGIAGELQVDCWGGGGGGGAKYSTGPTDLGAGGGGGGAYAGSVVSVVPGQVYTIVVGAGGSNGGNGSDSSFGTTIVVAKGGNGVAYPSYMGGKGGQASACTGTTTYSGGDGGSVPGNGNGFGAGGGGGAGDLSAGGNGGTTAGGMGGSGTDAANQGGMGGNGAQTQTQQAALGNPGTGPGGGGGGSYSTLNPNYHYTLPGSSGGAGEVILTYTPVP